MINCFNMVFLEPRVYREQPLYLDKIRGKVCVYFTLHKPQLWITLEYVVFVVVI